LLPLFSERPRFFLIAYFLWRKAGASDGLMAAATASDADLVSISQDAGVSCARTPPLFLHFLPMSGI
jgi:hypothetical protein